MTRTTDRPRVSVIIPAYNVAWCVRRAVDSVLAQSLRELEVIAINDGSTDETLEVLAAYGDAIQVIDQANGGLSSARNAGIRVARGEYIAFLDADDWWLPEKLARQIELMESRPDLGFCSVATQVQDPRGTLLRLWACPEWDGAFLTTLFHQPAAVAGSGSGVMARRALFDQAGLFDETLRSLEDIDMWMRLAAISGYACIAEPLAVILKRPGSMSLNLEVMRDAAIGVMNKNRALLPAHLRGGFWRRCMASVYTDYAKGAYRAGRVGAALADTWHAFLLAPFGRGRLCLGLLRDMVLRREL